MQEHRANITLTRLNGVLTTVAGAGTFRVQLARFFEPDPGGPRDIIQIVTNRGVEADIRTASSPHLHYWRNAATRPLPEPDEGQVMKMGATEIGHDVDGDGVPDIIISQNEPNGTVLWHVVSMTSPPVLVGEARGDGAWRHPPGEALPLLEIPQPGAGPGGAVIVLRHRDRALRLYPNRMRRPVPRLEAIAADAAALRAAFVEGRPPVELGPRVLSLIFSGNAAAAWQLLDAAWAGDDEMREAYVAALRNVPYVAEVAAASCGADWLLG
jgi:hypothetical protein